MKSPFVLTDRDAPLLIGTSLRLALGPISALVIYLWLPVSGVASNDDVAVLSQAGRATLAVMGWMSVWWLTEAIPIYATALLPIAIFPLLGIASMDAACTPYGHPLIFLFMGGFLLALAMERWGLGKRLALTVLRRMGTKPANMVAGFMAVTAVLSGFVSNTATAAMMLPIAISVIALVQKNEPSPSPTSSNPSSDTNNFSVCLLLGIAYSASIGGMATMIGSPPNVFLASYLRDSIAIEYRTDLSFSQWLGFGVPLSLTFLPILFFLLTRLLFPLPEHAVSGGGELFQSELSELGKIGWGEKVTLGVFLLTATGWVMRPQLASLSLTVGGDIWTPLAGLTDTGIVMVAAMLLFTIPVNLGRGEFVLDWPTAIKLPWGVLVLFGGGLSLAAAVEKNGVAEYLGSHVGSAGGLPDIVIVGLVTAAIVFLTELTSNTATAATLIPVLGATAPGLGMDPYLLVIPAALAASCAFMLPIATPPNAIVFASGKVPLSQMVRTGIWLNLIAIVLITLLTVLVIPNFQPA